MSVTVLLADDHPFIRRGLRNLLETESGMQVVGEAEDGLQALELAEKLHPQVLVVDLMMPNLNGLEVIRTLRRRSPRTYIIVLSMQSAEPYVVEAFRAGALGYVLKDGAPGELLQAVRRVLDGNKYISPKLPERLAEQMEDSGSMQDAEALTERERQVFQMAAEGKTAIEIASRLSISPRTVELHRSRVMDKLGVKNQTELVRYAVKRGVLPPEV